MPIIDLLQLKQQLLKDFTAEELQSLKPDRVRASNDLYEALKSLTLACPRHSYTQTELLKAHEALSKADGGK